MTPLSKTLLVTHKSCLDGTGSALMYVWAGGERSRVLFRSPSGLQLKPDDVPRGVEEVWYADCCPQDLTDPAAGYPFRVFDHHVSAQRVHGSDLRCCFDMAESGTSLLAQKFALNGLGRAEDEFIAAMRDYDLGRFDNPAGLRLADLAATFSQDQLLDLFIEREAEGIMYDRDLTARAQGASALRALYCEQAARMAVSSTLSLGGPVGSVVIACAAVAMAWKNDTAKQILDTREAIDVAVIFDVMGGMVSLRSRDGGPDCSVIAGLYGGGGHARAAGFKMPKGIEGTVHSLIKGAFG